MNKPIFIKFSGNYYVSPKGTRHKKGIFKCECGKEFEVMCYSIKSGATKSCGCANLIKPKTHGMTHSRIYRIWAGMITRCYNLKMPTYKHYGGRGIKVCDNWKNSFISFYEDMKDGYNETLQLDRINNEGDYTKSNCRWVTCAENATNKRTNVYYEYNGDKLTIAEFCLKYNISKSLVRIRLWNNWTIKEALETPPRKRNNRN